MTSAAGRQHRSESFTRAWLWCVALLVLAMVMLGGATRLTDSGLSITEWQVIAGVIPPLSEAEWVAAFEKYKTIPEFTIVNPSMTLGEFKFIYWWEWSHRLLGRIIGFALVVPFVALVLMRRLDGRTIVKLSVLVLLVALQGGLGWYMVRSGLVARVDVSQYRLAAHLALAALIYAGLVWTALGVGVPRRPLGRPLTIVAAGIVAVVLLQVAAGAFVAGLDAGLSHNTFPLMDGKLIPDGLLAMAPWWANFFENALTVQFNHRMLAYGLLGAVLLNAAAVSASRQKGAREISAWVLVFGVVVQIILGIMALLAQVPLHLALVHQASAFVLLTAAVIHLHLTARRI
jgi:cytochrome c oxidase assembly protein subunit 15